MPADKIVKFYHGASTDIQNQIDQNVINESDLIITSDTDELVYIDENKAQKPLGSSKTKEIHEVNIGGSLGGLTDGTEIPTGTTLDEFIAMLTQKSVPPTYTQPAVTIRSTAGQSAGNYEVGTNITTTLQATYTKNDGGDLGMLYIYETGTGFSGSDTVAIFVGIGKSACCFLTASETKTNVPFAPGTAPSTNIRLSASSTPNTFKF